MRELDCRQRKYSRKSLLGGMLILYNNNEFNRSKKHYHNPYFIRWCTSAWEIARFHRLKTGKYLTKEKLCLFLERQKRTVDNWLITSSIAFCHIWRGRSVDANLHLPNEEVWKLTRMFPFDRKNEAKCIFHAIYMHIYIYTCNSFFLMIDVKTKWRSCLFFV